MLKNITASDLRRAASIKEKIDSLNVELDELLGSAPALSAGEAPRKRRRMSAAARAKIAAAQKARWAKWKRSK